VCRTDLDFRARLLASSRTSRDGRGQKKRNDAFGVLEAMFRKTSRGRSNYPTLVFHDRDCAYRSLIDAARIGRNHIRGAAMLDQRVKGELLTTG